MKPILWTSTEFRMIWDNHPVFISAAKLSTEFIDHYTKHVQSAPCRARPKSREFNKAENKKKMSQTLVEPAYME